MTNRKQFVSINNTPSKKQNISCGVPQGSVLGPLLFSIYINDLPKASNFESRLFADDTALFLTDTNLKSLNYKVNMELSKVSLWLNANKLTLNHSKTTYLFIKPKSKSPDLSDFDVSVRGIGIKKCCTAKYLGVILDENLNWKAYVKYLQKKLSSAVGIIAKLRHYLNHKNLLSIYYAFFYSHILYGILGWGSATKTTLTPIQLLQNKVLRIMNKSTWNDRINNNLLYQKYSVLKITELYQFELGKFTYLYHAKALEPEIFATYFLPLHQAHSYSTRSASNKNYFLDNIRTNDGKSSIQFNGVQLWNQIPLSLKSYSFYRFKKEYKKSLIEKYK